MSHRGDRVALAALLLVLAGCGDLNAPRSAAPPIVPPPIATPPSVSPFGTDAAIYVARADGSAGVAITHGQAPVWSPDGKRIAFYRSDGWSYVVDIDSAAVRPLAEGVLPEWSPDGRRVVVYRRDVIFVIDVESGREFRLASGQYAAWSPDGARIAFNNQIGIGVIDADGTDYHTIVRHGLDAAKHPGILDVFVIMPVWSPYASSEQIAFTLQDVDHGSPLGAYVVNADGSGVQALSGDVPFYSPSWSPDGSRVALVTSPDRKGVLVRDMRCCEADLLIGLPDANAVPVSNFWSPDGSRIAFDAYTPITGSYDVWIGPAGGGDARKFISDAASLAWSPDGQRVAFIRPSER
jgi:Tol biopolymer transport system component